MLVVRMYYSIKLGINIMVSQCKYEELKLTFESAAQIKLVDLVDHRDLRAVV